MPPCPPPSRRGAGEGEAGGGSREVGKHGLSLVPSCPFLSSLIFGRSQAQPVTLAWGAGAGERGETVQEISSTLCPSRGETAGKAGPPFLL